MNETQTPNRTKHRIVLAAAFIITISLAFTAGFFSKELLTGQQFPLLSQAVSIVQNNGLKPLPAETDLEYGMIQGMLKTYDDPYTVFVAPPQNKLQTEQLQGSFGGIGVRLVKDEQGYTLLYPLPDSTALAAGIQDGDRLLAVESQSITTSTSIENIQAEIRGPVGKKVTITVGRAPNYSPIKYQIQRAQISLPSVTWNLTPENNLVGIIQVSIISSTTSSEIQKAVADLEKQGAKYFILDLRNNGGGLLDSGIDVAKLFLKKGPIIDEQYRGKAVQSFSADQSGPLSDIPLVVLINQGTASAAEIIAGSLQAQGRAQLIGSSSYGKDTIQLVFDLPGGASLHVTAAKWWVPGHIVPLKPDYSVAEDPNSDAVVAKAVQVVSGK